MHCAVGRVVAGLLLVLGAGLAAAQPIELRDDRGASLSFSAPPQRVVALLPSLTEMVWALGAGSTLVGVDRWSNWPAEVARLPHLGDLDDARIEAIVALKPDVVLASTASRALERLQALGVKVVWLKSDSHADVMRSLALLGRLFAQPQAAEHARQRIEREIDAAAARVPPALRGASVYFEVGGGPYAAGSASFIGQTLARLGLENIVPAALGPFPQLNPEFVLRARPGLMMGAQRDLARWATRPGWAALPALRQQRLCAFDAATYEMLLRPGPRMGHAAGVLADCLQRVAYGALAPPSSAP